jgi:hypothetical protein
MMMRLPAYYTHHQPKINAFKAIYGEMLEKKNKATAPEL